MASLALETTRSVSVGVVVVLHVHGRLLRSSNINSISKYTSQLHDLTHLDPGTVRTPPTYPCHAARQSAPSVWYQRNYDRNINAIYRTFIYDEFPCERASQQMQASGPSQHPPRDHLRSSSTLYSRARGDCKQCRKGAGCRYVL
jgi:hypothetical protein